MIELEQVERRFTMAELARWHQEMLNHLRDHEAQAAGKFPQTTLICDHVGGAFCIIIERHIELARQHLAALHGVQP